MKIYVYEAGMSQKEQKDGAYFERNMLALLLAKESNREYNTGNPHYKSPVSGWYIHGEWEGWARVISLYNGKYTFHVPDDFDMGDLPQIEPNWDGHSTKEKWERVADKCKIKIK